MKIAVCGLWHLGSVTAACLADGGHDVLGFDPQPETLASFEKNKAPIFEPGLDELIAKGKKSGKLTFTSSLTELHSADLVWVTFDTPVDEEDKADVDFVLHHIQSFLPHLQANTLILISSQIPVGTTRQLAQFSQKHYPEKKFTFACSPENLRLGKAIEIFTHPDRVIVGLETAKDKTRIQALLQPITDKIIWMSLESAEMTKHAINAFLATSVTFINEIATLCERVGADAREVEQGLKSEERIGSKAYVRPGNAIAGGTLARDVQYIIQASERHHVDTPLFQALLNSNQAHKKWSCQRLVSLLKELRGKTITLLGLTYKPGTDTLRRSTAIETAAWLAQQGATVQAYDPVIQALPSTLDQVIELKKTLEAALQKTDAVLIGTEWPQFSELTVETLLANAKQPFVLDASGFLMKTLGHDPRVSYFTVGRQNVINREMLEV